MSPVLQQDGAREGRQAGAPLASGFRGAVSPFYLYCPCSPEAWVKGEKPRHGSCALKNWALASQDENKTKQKLSGISHLSPLGAECKINIGNLS